MIAKVHNSQGRLLLAVCDENLLNKKIEEGEFVLDLTSGFFNGEKTKNSVLVPLIKKAYIINAVGKEATDLLVKEGIIAREDVLSVKKVPFAQVLFEAKR
jgi:uncharacterized protein